MVVRARGARSTPATRCRWQRIPLGTLVHNVELTIGSGGQIARSAGSYAQVMAKEGDYVTLRLPSGEVRMVHRDATPRSARSATRSTRTWSAARPGARAGWACRPTVRGVAMNPVDHPHGGGEGRTSGGRHPVTPWGKPTKGYKTRKKKPSDALHRAPAQGQEVTWRVRPRPVGRTEEGSSMARSIKKGPFVDDHLLEEGRDAEQQEREAGRQDLVAAFDDRARVSGPHHRRAQRQAVHARLRPGKHGGAQARRVRADADLPRPHQQEEEVTLAVGGYEMEASAVSRYIRISPRKARLVADLIRGKTCGRGAGDPGPDAEEGLAACCGRPSCRRRQRPES